MFSKHSRSILSGSRMAETSVFTVKIPNTDQLIAQKMLEWKRGIKYYMRKDCASIASAQDIVQMSVRAN